MPLLTTDPAVLKADGCELASDPIVFAGLMMATNNDPCTTGCYNYQDGKCTAFRKHHSKFQPARIPTPPSPQQQAHTSQFAGQWAGKSIKTIAKEQGISQNEVRRRAERGEYKV